ncbi:hypothetical protein PG987_008675 [Apiospora arundinis]
MDVNNNDKDDKSTTGGQEQNQTRETGKKSGESKSDESGAVDPPAKSIKPSSPFSTGSLSVACVKPAGRMFMKGCRTWMMITIKAHVEEEEDSDWVG